MTALAEAAADLRARAMAVDADPDDMTRHLGSPALRMMRQCGTPAEYGGAGDTCLTRVTRTVELARGDAGVVLAMPGPGLAGVAVDVLGSPEQRERFYRTVASGDVWTFFAMTEPERGNDTTAITTLLRRRSAGEYALHGRKRYIGNGARGGIGVVFARTGPSPLSIRAVLVEPARGFHARRLDMVGLRGACLSELMFDGLRVTADMVLGEHLTRQRGGRWGALRTFHHLRVQVAALAVGTALAIRDLVANARPDAPGLGRTGTRLAAARQFVHDVAEHLDDEPDQAYFPSAAKLSTVPLAIDVSRWAIAALGPGSLFEHPLLEKWTRDVRAFEFMEGTTNLQRLNVAQDYLKGRGDG